MAMDKNGKELPKGITLRVDGRYMGRFTFKGESYTLYDKDLKTLKKKMADLKYEVEHGMFAREENITVDGWFNVWINEYKINRVKQGTIVNYRNNFEYYIRPVLGKKKLKDVHAEQIQKLFNDMVKNEYSIPMIKVVSIILNSMYKQALKNGIVQKNPVEVTTLPIERNKQERRVLSIEEQKIFLEYAKDSKFYAIYCLALATGMRNGELRALEWKDIDFKNELIHINGTLKHFQGQGFVKDTPKTIKSKRSIPMMENGKPIPENYLMRDMNKIVKNINHASKEKANLEKGTVTTFESASPHTLRHTFATRGIENGITPKVMQEILGHGSFSMTMDLYAHVLPDTKANEMKKIANLF